MLAQSRKDSHDVSDNNMFPGSFSGQHKSRGGKSSSQGAHKIGNSPLEMVEHTSTNNAPTKEDATAPESKLPSADVTNIPNATTNDGGPIGDTVIQPDTRESRVTTLHTTTRETSLGSSVREVANSIADTKSGVSSAKFVTQGIRKIWKGKEQRSTDTVCPVKDARETDIIILIMGPTGVGKSTFINTAAGADVTRVGHDLTSCTDAIEHVIVQYPNDPTRRVVFVDTPGFNHTYTDDSEVLRQIVAWLACLYSGKMKLAGVIYLDEISRARTAVVARNLRVFHKLIGNDASRNVILATTKWGDVEEEVGFRNEEQLSAGFWKEMVEHGSRIAQFLDTKDSAWNIVDLITEREPLSFLRIRKELVDLEKLLPKSKAGGTLRTRNVITNDGEPVWEDAVQPDSDITSVITPVNMARKTWKGDEQKVGDTIMKVEDARDSDIIIPIMGPTGVGKSTFINIAVGQNKATVGHSLRSCTANLQHVIIPYPGDPSRRIVLVDTPGFDDTYLDDFEILRRIAVWLARSYSDRMKLAGVLYLYNISDPRISGTTCKTLELFQKLCGDDACKNIILVTTHWAQCDSEEQGKQREDELSTMFFRNMLDHGATCARFDREKDTAWDIINLVARKRPLDALQIQKELVDLEKLLPETEAAASLCTALKALADKCDGLLERRGGVMSEDEQEELRETERKLRAVIAEIDDLKIPLGRRVTTFFGRR